jgi:hypothetical protein
MTYQFDTEHAKKYGVDEAILIQNFAFWIAKNKANNRHEHEDRTWTYNSYKAFAELFEFWSEGQIRTRIESLIDQGVIIKGNFSKNTYDRTTWYAFKDEESFVYQSQKELSKSTNGSEQVNNSSTSTDNKPYSNPESARVNGCPIPEPLQVEGFKERYESYLAYLKETHKLTPSIQSVESNYRKLIELKQAGNDPLKVMDQTMNAVNKSFYELRSFDDNSNEQERPKQLIV